MKTKKLETVDGRYLIGLANYLKTERCGGQYNQRNLRRIARRFEALAKAAKTILYEYESLMDSGDAGFFNLDDVSKKPEVKLIKSIKYFKSIKL